MFLENVFLSVSCALCSLLQWREHSAAISNKLSWKSVINITWYPCTINDKVKPLRAGILNIWTCTLSAYVFSLCLDSKWKVWAWSWSGKENPIKETCFSLVDLVVWLQGDLLYRASSCPVVSGALQRPLAGQLLKIKKGDRGLECLRVVTWSGRRGFPAARLTGSYMTTTITAVLFLHKWCMIRWGSLVTLVTGKRQKTRKYTQRRAQSTTHTLIPFPEIY